MALNSKYIRNINEGCQICPKLYANSRNKAGFIPLYP
jgi:hypothetical protein